MVSAGIPFPFVSAWAGGRRGAAAPWLGALTALALLGAMPVQAQDRQIQDRQAQDRQNLTERAEVPQSRAVPGSFADLAEKLSPAVVNISTTQTIQGPEQIPMPQFPPGSPFEEFFKDFFDQRGGAVPQRVQSLGSGFIIDPSGVVVSNNHVIGEAEEIQVTLENGESYEAEVLGRDPKTDLTVLKIKADTELPFVQFGDSSAIRVGDWVLAIGNPFGLGGSVTAGIISARSREIGAGPYDDFLQTDAAINRGNSGGPLFDMNGKVVGVNTAIISPTGGSIGIGFAVPSNIAQTVVSQLREFGETRRGWIGVRIQSVTPEIAEGLGLDSPRGALVAGITPGGPAAKAGLQPGDVILSFNGKPIEEMRVLPRLVAETAVGETSTLEVWRDGKTREFRIDLGRLEEAEQAGLLDQESGQPTPAPTSADTEQSLGLTLAPLTPALRQRFEVAEGVNGVVVLDVDPASAAAEKGIMPGDIIVEVGQESVQQPEDVVAKIDQVRRSSERKSVLLFLSRNGEDRFVALRVDDQAGGQKQDQGAQ